MFADGFVSFTIEGLLGLIVTIVGIWLVVKQLSESKLSSQMEGVLNLTDRFIDISDSLSLVDDLAGDKGWAQLSEEEAHSRFLSDTVLRAAVNKVGKFYELLSVLVQTGALDKELAFKLYGEFVHMRWKLIKAPMYGMRKQNAMETIAAEWEWLATEFELMSK